MSMQRGRAISKYAVIALACAISMLALEATRVFAKNSGNFGGDYTVIKAVEQGENEVVKVSLRVINNSGADVKNASITIASSPHFSPRPTDAWEKDQTPIKASILRFNEHKVLGPLVGTFTIPAAEYQRWSQRGSGPNFMITYQDASGEQHYERMDLAPVQ
jgi:hypothetical protein